jgi:alkane 1-monooxygenase
LSKNNLLFIVVLMKYSRYLFACIPSILCIVGNLNGGLASALNLIYSMLFMPLAEWLISDDASINEEQNDNLFPTFILILLSSLHLSVTLTLCYGIFTSKLSGIYIIIGIISSGINAGTNGIVVAHELIHRKQFLLRVLGILNLIQVNYGHFYIEHIKGHHKFVGTAADPATAKYGESLYKFVLRTIPGQFISAFLLEQKRLFDQNKSQLLNFVILIVALQIAVLIAMQILFGNKIMLAYLLYSFVAIFLLEYVNYIEHYGLQKEDNKKFEAHHAWQSNKISSRLGLIELSRHSDHHMKAAKPYHTLNSHEGFFLPSGYYGMFYIALIPTWWFKMINPIIDASKHKFN